MTYNIISSGSKGNAVILEDTILIDCGVSFKAVKPYIGRLCLVLLTHEHGDHFTDSTVRKLAEERPTLRFGCGIWLLNKLLSCGVSKHMIDIYSMDSVNPYGIFEIEAFQLYHNVLNCGYKICIGGRRALYATDTCKITTSAPGYDLYMIEGNYDEDELRERIARKQAAGASYINELVVPDNHLSRTDASTWLMENMDVYSEYVFLHQHKGTSA